METEAIIVSKELKDHYNSIVKFRDELTKEDTLAKNSDIISAMNAITRILGTLTKQLQDAHNAENIAAVKQILISVLKETDSDLAETYIARLKERNLA